MGISNKLQVILILLVKGPVRILRSPQVMWMHTEVSEPRVLEFCHGINLTQILQRLWLDPNNLTITVLWFLCIFFRLL